MAVSDLTASAQDYLKVIWSATEWSGAPVTVGMMAARLGVSASTASEGIRKLSNQGLVSHARYGSIELTAEGREQAVAMVRRHRLLETFLVQALGYAWDEVHHEAEVLEHAVSDTLISRIDALLDHPVRDPHGDPIPAADGQSDRPDAIQLTAVEPGRTIRICRVSDADPARLRHFSRLGLTLDTEFTVVERRSFSAAMTVRVHGQGENIELGLPDSDAIWVVPGSRLRH
ncbi:metal-dependent transcriptional regulator [Arthrobacter sp. H-02-3]|uniref:metal-dependent transcriptional regulator n=1 Tax=Arthrobacter sp. H-02-3 TaxID=2703675 RepID=UPI000DD27C08|nr:metal-dependent transcriptional regulator [Arthrobacter sp. H-02-3]PVZ60911.1 metal-dependent transcriptional regulator [Arthrobacter sp. H-02-3]